MDPQAALNQAGIEIEAGNLREASELLTAYRAWRHRGGFEPLGGDDRAAQYLALVREFSLAIVDHCEAGNA